MAVDEMPLGDANRIARPGRRSSGCGTVSLSRINRHIWHPLCRVRRFGERRLDVGSEPVRAKPVRAEARSRSLFAPSPFAPSPSRQAHPRQAHPRQALPRGTR